MEQLLSWGIFQFGIQKKAGHGMLVQPKIKNLESPLMSYIHINETRTTLPIEDSIGLMRCCEAPGSYSIV